MLSLSPKIAVFALVFAYSFVIPLQTVHSRNQAGDSLTVAGFVNLGESENDYLNVLVTTYMTTFLTKILKKVPSFEDVERLAGGKRYWGSGTDMPLAAISIAEDLGTRFCLTGHYRVEKGGMTVFVMNIYDIEKHNLVLERRYKSTGDSGLFVTIDSMIKDTLFLTIGSTVELGRLKVTVNQGSGEYRLFLNGSDTAGVSVKSGYEGFFTAGQFIDVSLRKTGDLREVLRKRVKIENVKVVEIDHRPVADLHLVSAVTNAGVYLNRRFSGKTGPDGALLISSVDATLPVELELRENGRSVTYRKVHLNESASNRIDLSGASAVSVNFPLQAGMKGWFSDIYTGAGIELVIQGAFRTFLYFGGIFYSTPQTGSGWFPFLDVGTGWLFLNGPLWKAGVNLAAEIFIVSGVMIHPAITLELQFWNFFLSAGARYSFEANGGGFYPIASIGYRF